jgi:bleomycin hydrolase
VRREHWGEKNGDKGYYLINDNWFDQYMFEVAAPRNCVPDNLLGVLEEDPIVLPPGIR